MIVARSSFFDVYCCGLVPTGFIDIFQRYLTD